MNSHNIAASLSDLEKRLKRFFAPDTVRTAELHNVLFAELSQAGHIYVIGGAIRDLAYFGAEARPISDIDLVISGRSASLDKIAQRLSATPNRFGGYGINYGGMKVDFWSINRTWAKVNNHVNVTCPQHLLKCTFFDWDAVLFNINTGKLLADPGYLTKLHKGVLEINLLPNPSPHGNLVRALRRLVMFDIMPGKRLRWFINDRLRTEKWSELLDSERNAFHIQYLEQFRSSQDFQKQFLCERVSSIRRTDTRRQLRLPL